MGVSLSIDSIILAHAYGNINYRSLFPILS
jgi:hypothetical protein